MPDLSFYSEASDVGWGAIMGEQQVSGVWTPSQKQVSITLREMMAVQNGLLGFSQLLRGKTIALFCDNVTTVAYLRRSGGTRSEVLFLKAREITTLPQFIQGSLNTRADLLSRPNLVIGSEWTLHQQVVQDLLLQWPAIIDLFPSLADGKTPSVLCPSVGTQGNGSRCIPPTLGQPPGVCLPSNNHHKESSSQSESLSPLRSHPDRPLFASKGRVSRSSGTSIRHSNRTTQTSRSAATTAFPSVSRKSPNASSDCVATLKRFARQAGFSETVAGQLAPCRRTSTRLNYQARWGKFRKWCIDSHHRSSEPTIPNITEFLTERAAVSTIKAYRSMLSSVFKFCLLEISTSPIFKDLTRPFKISAPRPVHRSPSWDLDKVLEYLSGPPLRAFS